MISSRLAKFIIAIFFLAPSIASAAESYFITPSEMAVLPHFCYIKQFYGENKNHPEEQAIYDMLGADYVHMHHYCWGLNYANRADKNWGDKTLRSYELSLATKEFNYILSHVAPDFFMRPEIYLRLGKVLRHAGNPAEAAQNFLKAIEAKPDYIPAYLALSDFYKEAGNLTKALSLLEDGLKQDPSSRGLARRYKELGGKLPIPEINPVVTGASRPESLQAEPAESEKTAAETTTLPPQKNTPPEQKLPGETPQNKTGSPSNPWCRFCTDDVPLPAGK